MSETRPGTRPLAATAPDLLAQDRTIRALVSLVSDMTVDHDEQGLLRSTLEHVVQALGLSGGTTFVLDAQGQLVAAAECRTASGEGTLTADLASEALSRQRPLLREAPGGGWIAAAPIRTKERQLGVLTLQDQHAASVAPEMELLEALGAQIGTGLDNVRLYAQLRESSARAQALNRITATLASSMDLKAVLPAFAQEIAAFQAFDRLACAFVNDSGDYIEVTAHPEDTSWGLGSVIPVVGSGPGAVVLNSQPVVQKDLLHQHRFIEDMRLLEEGVRSYLLLPLNARGRNIGVLALGSRQAGAYDEAAVARLLPLADAVALAFENVRLFQKTRELSITDEVTPLYNFRFFHQILDRELKLVDRYRSVLSLIFLDLDNFKPINDQYGHLRGSRTLREVGFLLRAAVRETDYPARYGGDEFVIILPQTDAEAAIALADKLRALIEGHTFLQEEGIDARIGCSIGVASYPGEARSKEGLIRLADERMYADKDTRKAGRR
jgi:diguanylate cyclase (GGDEF)-like protein